MCDNCPVRTDQDQDPGTEQGPVAVLDPGVCSIEQGQAPEQDPGQDQIDRSDAPDPGAWPVQDHYTITILCSFCGYKYVAQLSCGDRTCPVCRRKWYGYHFKSLKKIFEPVESELKFLTLTLKNIPDAEFGRASVKRLRDAWNKLLHRKIDPGNKLDKRRYSDYFKAGFYFIQLTNIGNGYHLHLHVIFAGPFIAKQKIATAWFEITRDSYIVDICRVRSFGRAVHYLLGDLLQKPRIRPGDRGKYNEALKGARLIQGFGSWARVKIRRPFTCPNCENDTWFVPKYEKTWDPDYWDPDTS